MCFSGLSVRFLGPSLLCTSNTSSRPILEETCGALNFEGRPAKQSGQSKSKQHLFLGPSGWDTVGTKWPLIVPLNAPLKAPLNAPLNTPLNAPLNAPLNVRPLISFGFLY